MVWSTPKPRLVPRTMKQKNPRDTALRFLTVRDRTEEELRQRLQRDAYSEDEIAATLRWLREIGYVDDRRTAKLVVQHHNRFRPMGRRGLEFELRRKGVGDEIIADVTNSAEDEYQLALALAQKRVERMRHLDPDKQYRRVGSLLGRRGFSWDIISRVLREVVSDSLDTNL